MPPPLVLGPLHQAVADREQRRLGAVGQVEEAELFARFRSTGDRRVRNEIVERHLGLAIHIAQRYTAGRSNDDDLRQVAMLGLVKAVDRFDPSYGSAFSSFAGSTRMPAMKTIVPCARVKYSMKAET